MIEDLARVFGGEGNRGLGVELSYLTPLPWYVELVASVTGASGRVGTGQKSHGSFTAAGGSPLAMNGAAAAPFSAST